MGYVLVDPPHGSVVDQDVGPAELGHGLLHDVAAMVLLGHFAGYQREAAPGVPHPMQWSVCSPSKYSSR